MTAIRQILNGGNSTSTSLKSSEDDKPLKAIAANPIDRLSDREREVFQSIAQGLSMREIAANLFISIKTVEAHREHVKRKLRLATSRELLRYAIRHARG